MRKITRTSSGMSLLVLVFYFPFPLPPSNGRFVEQTTSRLLRKPNCIAL
ncbi:hypothetical protein [Paenibacillus ottowii]|nr:hypothetical protein [Paenibacillus sp. CMAA1739]